MGDRVFIARQDTLEGVKADTEKLQRGQETAQEVLDAVKEDTEELKTAGLGLQISFPAKYRLSVYTASGMPWNAQYSCCFAAIGKDVHIFQGVKHFVFDMETFEWTQMPDAPCDTTEGCAVAFAGGIHLFGGRGGTYKHYTYENGEWTAKKDTPRAMTGGVAAVWNNLIILVEPNSRYITKWEPGTDQYSIITSGRNYSAAYFGAFVWINNLHIFGGNTETAGTMHDFVDLRSGTVTAATALPVPFNRINGDYAFDYGLYIRSFRAQSGNTNKAYYFTKNSADANVSIRTAENDNGNGTTADIWRYSYGQVTVKFQNMNISVPAFGYEFWLPKDFCIWYKGSFLIVGGKSKGNNIYEYEQKEDGVVTLLCQHDKSWNFDLGGMVLRTSTTIASFLEGFMTIFYRGKKREI